MSYHCRLKLLACFSEFTSLKMWVCTFLESIAMLMTGLSSWNKEYCAMIKAPSMAWSTFRTFPFSVQETGK